jgi:hypothetical protein
MRPESFSGASISMHVLFIVPRFAVPGQFYQYSIGLAYVYAFLKRHGVSVSCLNLCHESSTDTYALLERECAKQAVRGLKNPIDSRFYDFCQFFRKGAVKLTTN